MALKIFMAAALALGTFVAGSTGASAQDNYPNKPITFVLGVSPGGLTDVTARQLAAALSIELGQQVVVENRPGASTSIGAQAALTAAPDGYTFFYGGVMSASPIFVKNGAVDFATQMKPVSKVLSAPFYLLINSNVPAKTVEELVAYTKANPKALNFADGAPLGTMVMASIASRTGLDYTSIPYKGSAPSMNALIANEIDVTLDTVPNYLQYIKAGTVKALMNTSDARLEGLPDVPAGSEIKGIDFTAASVQSLWAPPGTPDEIIKKLNDAVVKVANEPEFQAKFEALAMVKPSTSTPEELLKAIEADKELYTAAAKQIGYQPQ